MSSIIQNLACFEVKIDAKSGRFYFNEDILQDKCINTIWLFFSNQDAAIRSPFSVSEDDDPLSSIEDVEFGSGLYLNVTEPSGKEYIKNLAFPNLAIDSEAPLYPNVSYAEIHIGRKIDARKSYFNAFIPELQDIFTMLMFVSYDTKPQSINHSNTRGSFTAEIPIPRDKEIYSARLSDYIPREYQKLKIKQILFSNADTYSYLNIKADGAFVENIPGALLFNKGTTKNVFFDLLNIDYEESFLLYRGFAGATEKEIITFLY